MTCFQLLHFAAMSIYACQLLRALFCRMDKGEDNHNLNNLHHAGAKGVLQQLLFHLQSLFKHASTFSIFSIALLLHDFANCCIWQFDVMHRNRLFFSSLFDLMFAFADCQAHKRIAKDFMVRFNRRCDLILLLLCCSSMRFVLSSIVNVCYPSKNASCPAISFACCLQLSPPSCSSLETSIATVFMKFVCAGCAGDAAIMNISTHWPSIILIVAPILASAIYLCNDWLGMKTVGDV